MGPGRPTCPACKRAKQFFGEQRVPYVNIDIEQDAEAMAFVERVNGGKRIIPTIVFPDGSMLVEPSNAQLAEKLGLQTKAQRAFYDSIVIGGGPARPPPPPAPPAAGGPPGGGVAGRGGGAAPAASASKSFRRRPSPIFF